MDPLSDVLSLLKVRSYMSGNFNAGGDWAIRFGPHQGIKFQAVMQGECWLCVDEVPEPVRIRAGDCYLLPRGRPFRVASDLSLEPADAEVVLPRLREERITAYNGGGDFFSVGGFFALAGPYLDTLLGALPPIVLIREHADKEVLRWCLKRMGEELHEPQPGGALVAQQLATMLLVQVLRLHLSGGPAHEAGWLFALSDKPMRAALSAMHAEPAQRWTLQSLAACAGMSRTTFALKFKERVGVSAMDYLTRWRMMLAADRLMHSSEPISSIALALGYESDSAFSTAFRRVMGLAPRQYAREQGAS